MIPQFYLLPVSDRALHFSSCSLTRGGKAYLLFSFTLQSFSVSKSVKRKGGGREREEERGGREREEERGGRKREDVNLFHFFVQATKTTFIKLLL